MKKMFTQSFDFDASSKRVKIPAVKAQREKDKLYFCDFC
jgi:hypothetical protein